MKKMFILLFLFLIPLRVNALSAETFVVMDQSNGRVLKGENINKQKLIASTTKIMTCVIALEYGNLNKIITVDENVLKAYGSAIYIQLGEKISLNNLLYGLMLRSGNDAALVIANNVAPNEEKFVKMMNKKAVELNMSNTIFYNPHGLEDHNGKGNISTAYDMALLTKYAMANPKYRQIVKTKKIEVKTNYKTYIWFNKNKLLNQSEYVTGGKTGFTKKARRTLVSTATKDNKDLIIVTLNDSNDFADHLALYNSVFANYNYFLVIDNHQYIKNDYYPLLKSRNKYQLLVTKDEESKIKIITKLEKKSFYQNNEKVGYINVYIGDEFVHQEPVFVFKEKTKLNIFKRINNWLQHLF